MSSAIYIRADGNSKIGLGHITRSMALGQMLKNFFDIHFVCKDVPSETIIDIRESGFEFIKIEMDQDLISIINMNDIVILDHYDLKSDYEKKIKNTGAKLVCIDDLNCQEFYADLIINHAPNIQASEYRAQPYTNYALGSNYALLRAPFIEYARKKRVIDTIDTAFICFGGADFYDLSLQVANELIDIEQLKTINIVLGNSYKHTKIYDLAAKTDKLKLHKSLDASSMAELMYNSNIAVVPSSTILYEVCAVKMPVFSGYFVENQKVMHETLSILGIIESGGNFKKYLKGDFYTKVNDFLINVDIDKILKTQQQLIDGKSVDRLVDMIRNTNIEYERATEDHLKLVFDWSNDESVRKNSYQSEIIDFDDHKDWYRNKLKDENSIFIIPNVKGKPAGLVRYEVKSDHILVGILVCKEFRGQKLAPLFLRNTATLILEKYKLPIWAYIKKANKASIRTFEKAGYSFYKDEMINNIDSFVYKLDRK